MLFRLRADAVIAVKNVACGMLLRATVLHSEINGVYAVRLYTRNAVFSAIISIVLARKKLIKVVAR